ncbi:MAG: D-alanine--D-alanine ligase [Parcubacteria group bacterium]
MKKLNVGVLFGGRSSEHEISLISAANVISALDKKKYNIYPIGISKEGKFFYFKGNEYILNSDNPKKVRLNDNGTPISFMFGGKKGLFGITNHGKLKLDVVFPVLHGAFGEDGAIQGLFRLADVAFVGTGVLGSAVCMDKEVAKKLLCDAGIRNADFLVFNKSNKVKPDFQVISGKLGLPFYVKPANSGSSVGVHRIEKRKEFLGKVSDAFRFDNKIIFEKNISGKEIECSVLGNENVIASLPGRVIPKDGFYSYQVKYLEKDAAQFEIPAKLNEKTIKMIQNIAVQAYKTLNCEGCARVDGFLTKKNEFIVNEINTMPGFTSISMYPKLWNVSGLSTSKLIDKLIKLAIEKYKKQK